MFSWCMRHRSCSETSPRSAKYALRSPRSTADTWLSAQTDLRPAYPSALTSVDPSALACREPLPIVGIVIVIGLGARPLGPDRCPRRRTLERCPATVSRREASCYAWLRFKDREREILGPRGRSPEARWHAVEHARRADVR